MRIGYIRVSTAAQDLALQRDALTSQTDKIFEDVMTGSSQDRPGLQGALDFARYGDTLVVWRLDRLARSVKHLIEIISLLEKKGVQLRSLKENIDTSCPTGKLIFHIFSAIAEFERDLIRERTKAGLEAARRRGRKGGRPKIQGDKLDIALLALQSGQKTVREICRTFQIGHSTLYRARVPKTQQN